jgi:replicative DNA helicase
MSVQQMGGVLPHSLEAEQIVLGAIDLHLTCYITIMN